MFMKVFNDLTKHIDIISRKNQAGHKSVCIMWSQQFKYSKESRKKYAKMLEVAIAWGDIFLLHTSRYYFVVRKKSEKIAMKHNVLIYMNKSLSAF